MGEWLSNNAWFAWLVVTLIMVGLELLTLDLLFAMIAVGALGGLLTALLGGALPLQLIVAAVAALAMVFAVRPVALRHLRAATGQLASGVDRLIGERVAVIEPVSASAGLVSIAGQTWSARGDDDEPIPPGEAAYVVAIDGATAVVSRWVPDDGAP